LIKVPGFKNFQQESENMSDCSRRIFLKASGAVAAAAVTGAGRLAARPLHLPIGLQLYSVRSLLPIDFDGTLAKVRADGYTVVEAAGYYDHTAADFRKAMDKAGLRCVSTHHTLSQLETQFAQWIEYAQTLGLEYIVCSSSGGMHRDPTAKGPATLDDWRWIAGEFNHIGARVKAAGMTFGVHNHKPEFAVIDGVLVYDELLRLTDPNLVVFEMDAGWVYASGHDPLDYLRKTPERFPLMHVKDMIRGADGKVQMTVLGKGGMDYGPILSAATGLKYYFVEQEQFDMEPIEELRLDADYMRKLSV
jgi:sugar phosphate isomerase/epimerase